MKNDRICRDVGFNNFTTIFIAILCFVCVQQQQEKNPLHSYFQHYITFTRYQNAYIDILRPQTSSLQRVTNGPLHKVTDIPENDDKYQDVEEKLSHVKKRKIVKDLGV